MRPQLRAENLQVLWLNQTLMAQFSPQRTRRFVQSSSWPDRRLFPSGVTPAPRIALA
jgi:hypothetical protein